jgi:hypothetical protein
VKKKHICPRKHISFSRDIAYKIQKSKFEPNTSTILLLKSKIIVIKLLNKKNIFILFISPNLIFNGDIKKTK